MFKTTVFEKICFSLFLILALSFVFCEKEEKEEGKEEKVTEKEIPQAVLKAFIAQYPGAAVREYSEESENGKEYFEISFDHEGKTINLLYNTNGEVVESEETIIPQDMPGEIQKAIAGEIPQFSLERIEKIQKEGKNYFEAIVLNTKDNKKYELVFSDSAKLLEKKVMEEDED